MARILLADDSRSLLASVGLALRENGHTVTSTNSGADALCLATQQNYDLLILDIGMPDLDGYAVIRDLPRDGPPVVVITGAPVDDAAFDAGRVARVVPKPFTLGKLLQAVCDVLGKSAGD